jgi:tripartite-type tricarboxylate transporter receptor subunit TctC
MIKSPQVLVVYPGTGIKNMPDLLKVAKARADHFSFATPGAGTSSRLSTELFKQYAGIEATLVTYKGGSQAITDLMGGQVNAMIVSMSLVLQHIQTGRLTPIAVSSSKQISQLPDIPPIADTFAGFEAQSWTGMVAPAGTPKAVIDKLNSALIKALNSPDFKDKFTSQGVEVVGSSPEGFADWMAKESTKWSQVIKQRKISIE